MNGLGSESCANEEAVLVTGGLGFIGSHLVESFLGDGVSVITIDNLDRSTYDPMVRLQNLSLLKEAFRKTDTPFRFILGDTRDRALLRAIFSSYRIFCVVDLAARAGVRSSLLDPVGYIQTNVEGLVNLISAAKEARVSKIVYISSSSVYGHKVGMFSEDDASLLPGSPYGMTKLMAEKFLELHARLYGLSGVILRPFTVYGPRQRPEMAIYTFLTQIEANKPITLFGDGSMKRDFTHVRDVVAGIRKAVALSQSAGSVSTFNLGTSSPVSLLELVATLEEVSHKKAAIRFLPIPPTEPLQTCADIRRAKERLGYNPSVGLKEGLSDFVGWYNERVSLHGPTLPKKQTEV